MKKVVNSMVINIPIQINEQEMATVIKKDYEEKVMAEIVKYIIKAIEEKGRGYSYGSRLNDGMTNLIEEQIGEFIDEHKEDIVQKAGTILADKLLRTKRVKEMIDGLEKRTCRD